MHCGMTIFEDGPTALWADRCELRKKSLGQQIILELANKEIEYYGIFSSHSEGPLKYNSTTLYILMEIYCKTKNGALDRAVWHNGHN